MDWGPSGSSLSMGFPRQEYWSGLLFPSPGDLPNPVIEPGSLALAGRFFTSEPPGKSLFPSPGIQTCHFKVQNMFQPSALEDQ